MNGFRLLKWIGLLLIAIVYGYAWVEIAPPEADLPPCHYMVVLMILSAGTLAAWRAERRVRRERETARPDHEESSN